MYTCVCEPALKDKNRPRCVYNISTNVHVEMPSAERIRGTPGGGGEREEKEGRDEVTLSSFLKESALMPSEVLTENIYLWMGPRISSTWSHSCMLKHIAQRLGIVRVCTRCCLQRMHAHVVGKTQ